MDEDSVRKDLTNKTKLYEGKAKVVYPSDNPELVYMVFKDDATAFNGEKKGTIKGKGTLTPKSPPYCSSTLRRTAFQLISSRWMTTSA